MYKIISLGIVLILPAICEAQSQCLRGGLSTRFEVHGTGDTEGRLLGSAFTDRSGSDASACWGVLQTEVWIHPLGGAVVGPQDERASHATMVRDGSPGAYVARSKHWFVDRGNPLVETWRLLAELEYPFTVSGGGGGGNGSGICQLDPETGQQYGDCPPPSPIIIDIARDGYELTSVEEGVFFDLDKDGVAERIAWTKSGSDDAFLAMDRNGNGTIDNGSELFGTSTPSYNDQPYPTALNGFVALIFAEGPSYGRSKADRVITREDTVFSRLLLWTDRNHNGLSEPDELRQVEAAGLLSLSTDYRESGRRDAHGNEFRLAAPSSWNIEGRVVTYPVYDVWLRSASSTATAATTVRRP